MAKTKDKRVRTTVSLPQHLYEEARSLVSSKTGPSASINGLFVAALRAYLKLIQRKQIDAKFAAMSSDDEYQEESRRISGEFSSSDWEAFERAERDAQ
jgi:Arc/MetJ-type ribon-helix-helix transcriptional regulator